MPRKKKEEVVEEVKKPAKKTTKKKIGVEKNNVCTVTYTETVEVEEAKDIKKPTKKTTKKKQDSLKPERKTIDMGDYMLVESTPEDIEEMRKQGIEPIELTDEDLGNFKEIDPNELQNALNVLAQHAEDIKGKLKEIEESTKDIDTDIPGKEAMSREFASYKIPTSMFGYIAMRWIIDNVNTRIFDTRPTPADVMTKYAEFKKCTVEQVKGQIKSVIDKADFSHSVYIPIFASMPRQMITVSQFLTEYIDYLYETEE